MFLSKIETNLKNIGTIGKRLTAINLENNEANRRKYRQLLFTTPNVGEHISGVILYEETFHQVIFDCTSIKAF